MANRKQAEQNELRKLITEAIAQDIIEPRDVLNYVMDNGWQYGDVSMTTIQAVMKENGVVYVWGRWEKARG